MTIEDFLFSTLSNLVASLIVTFLLWSSRKFWLSGFYADISRVYKNEQKALKDINKDIKESKEIKMLIIRGTSLTDNDGGKYPSLWLDPSKKIEIILSSEDNAALIEDRAKATNDSPVIYRQKIINSNNILLLKMKDYCNLSIYKHTELLSFKLVICNQSLYVFYYPSKGDSHSSVTIRYKNNTGAYNAFTNYYEILKGKASTILLNS